MDKSQYGQSTSQRKVSLHQFFVSDQMSTHEKRMNMSVQVSIKKSYKKAKGKRPKCEDQTHKKMKVPKCKLECKNAKQRRNLHACYRKRNQANYTGQRR